MQKSKLMHSVAAIALLAGTMTMSFAANAAGQEQAAAAATPGAAVTDDSITVAAKTALGADTQIASLPISVTTHKGVVVLSGEVPSAAASQRVVQIVASVSGVKDVKNTLKVKAG